MFQVEMAVRDYECDMQGIVNNAVYLNYLEHARHAYLKFRGLDFATLTRQGIIVVVVRAELDYAGSLRSGDVFSVSVETHRQSPLRLAFEQKIHCSGRQLLRARIITTAVNERGKPWFPEALSVLLA